MSFYSEVSPGLLYATADYLGDKGLSYREKPFQLRAGGESHWYFDAKRAIAEGAILAHIGRLACTKLKLLGSETQIVCGMGSGGYAMMNTIVLTAREWLATHAYSGKVGDPDNGLWGAKVKGKKVLLVDDVLSTGDSLITTTNMIREEGGEVADCLVLLDRSKLIAGCRLANEYGLKVNALFEFNEEAGKIEPVM